MSNSSWAFNFKWPDGTPGEFIAAPSEDANCFKIRMRGGTTGMMMMAKDLSEDQVRRLISAAQAWLGEQADKRNLEP